VSLLSMLQRENLLPAVVFSFSKARCDEIAFGLAGRLHQLSSVAESAEVGTFFDACLERIRPEERSLPQLVRLGWPRMASDGLCLPLNGFRMAWGGRCDLP